MTMIGLTDQMAIEQMIRQGLAEGKDITQVLSDLMAEYQQSLQQMEQQQSMQNIMLARQRQGAMGGGYGGQQQGQAAAPGEIGVNDVLGTARQGVSAYGQMGGDTGSLPLGYILAAIQGQHMMSSDTDRQFTPSGTSTSHRTGDIFSGDFFTEPWMGYAADKLGMERATPGESTDASIDAIQDGESAWDNLLRGAPATAAQWFDPVGSFAFDWLGQKGGKFGDILKWGVMPVQGLARLID